MKTKFTIAGRSSALSNAQIEIFRSRAAARFPGIEILVKTLDTHGDRERSVPLHMIPGKDFFTQEIQQELLHGNADFAVHSMKDVSHPDFFSGNHYTIIDRDDPRDVAVCNSNVISRLETGTPLIVGSSSPRRSELAASFLRRALPFTGKCLPEIISRPIRGNVDSRLEQLHEGTFDIIILAAAGLNRLLRYQPAAARTAQLLGKKKIMTLPLFECPPAAGQGAIVVEASASNAEAIALLKAIGNTDITEAIRKERILAGKYGYGDSRPFGTFHMDTPYISFTYAGGKDTADQPFREWVFDRPDYKPGRIFSAADHMQQFFAYRLYDTPPEDTEDVYFISSHKAVHQEELVQTLQHKRVWAAGSKTWLELAEKGIWVEGCADGLGLEVLIPVLESPIHQIMPERIRILTNEESSQRWIAAGYKATPTYALQYEKKPGLQQLIRNADTLFWVSYQQYRMYRTDIKPGARHCCLAGKTSALLRAEGIEPHIFPDIRSFRQWQHHNITIPVAE